MTTYRVNTCIVGGGPAGLMLGLLLAKRGADVLVLERAAILCEGGLIAGEHLSFVQAQAEPTETVARNDPWRATPVTSETKDLRVMERAAIERALQDARHNKSRAAKMLGLSRKQLYVRLRQHGLE
jgi:DNA-binding NtrC family response regulator